MQTNLKPFGLEAFKAGKPALTRDGRKAWFIAYVPEFDEEVQLLVRIEGNTGATSYYKKGNFYRNRQDDDDLTHMAPETRTVYVNLYTGGVCDWYESESLAKIDAGVDAIAIAVPVAVPVAVEV